jgi:hypothetical protein
LTGLWYTVTRKTPRTGRLLGECLGEPRARIQADHPRFRNPPYRHAVQARVVKDDVLHRIVYDNPLRLLAFVPMKST